MGVAGLVVAIVAALAAIASAVVANGQRRSAAVAAEEARQDAVRANAAAEAAAEAAVKSAQAQETIAEIAARKASRPPWRLAHRAGDTFDAWNDGDVAVFDVTIDGPGVLRGPTTSARVDAGSSVVFWGNPGWVSDRSVRVRWASEPGGEQDEWSQQKPERPS